ncbi:hypothetical protein RRG08_043437 [Elysia crispata]|uniref:Uncharacterized protein n=1 Tax=Elysia crispata TaxID=231223 RepID=A0AAE0YL25_9GAST|nr:hypothetical protein RRG08_043437 [Elysia crispata]
MVTSDQGVEIHGRKPLGREPSLEQLAISKIIKETSNELVTRKSLVKHVDILCEDIGLRQRLLWLGEERQKVRVLLLSHHTCHWTSELETATVYLCNKALGELSSTVLVKTPAIIMLCVKAISAVPHLIS